MNTLLKNKLELEGRLTIKDIKAVFEDCYDKFQQATNVITRLVAAQEELVEAAKIEPEGKHVYLSGKINDIVQGAVDDNLIETGEPTGFAYEKLYEVLSHTFKFLSSIPNVNKEQLEMMHAIVTEFKPDYNA